MEVLSSIPYDTPQKGKVHQFKDVLVLGEKTESHGGEICEMYSFYFPNRPETKENPYSCNKEDIELVE